MNEEAAKLLREPFPAEAIGKLPRLTCRDCSDKNTNCRCHQRSRCQVCGAYISSAHIHLDYVGHAAVTDRLLQVDPEWSWEPVAFDDHGLPAIDRTGAEPALWIRLTICGTTRYGVGIASGVELQKQLISDAIRNAAMRFGVALDLWSKESLVHDEPDLPPAEPMASKRDVDLFKACVEELTEEQHTAFVVWKNDQGFSWPWSQRALDAMERELEKILVGSEASTDTADRATDSTDESPVGSEPTPDSDKVGSDEPSASPASLPAGVPEDLAAFSGEAF